MNMYSQCMDFSIFSKPMKEVMESTNYSYSLTIIGAIKVPINFYWLRMKVGTRDRLTSGINSLQSALMLAANREETAS